MQQIKKSFKCLAFSGTIAILLVFVDQWTKALAVAHLKDQAAFVIWKNVFELHYLENQSAAFGVDFISLLQKWFQFDIFTNNPDLFLKTKMLFFAVLTVLVVIIMIIFYCRIPAEKHFRWMNIVLILFITGAIGNFIDRIRLNYVVDFFYFKLINFPIFNVADIYVTVAAFLFIFLCLFYYRDEDFDSIFPTRKEKNEK